MPNSDDLSTIDFKTTRELVGDLKKMSSGPEQLNVILIDISHLAHDYMHDERYASASRLMSLNDALKSALDPEDLYEALAAHEGPGHDKTVIEDAFVQALEFSDALRKQTQGRIDGALNKSNGYAVSGISKRGQLVVGFFS